MLVARQHRTHEGVAAESCVCLFNLGVPRFAAKKDNDSQCDADDQCHSGLCFGDPKKCIAKKDDGADCTEERQCSSNACTNGKCGEGPCLLVGLVWNRAF